VPTYTKHWFHEAVTATVVSRNNPDQGGRFIELTAAALVTPIREVRVLVNVAKRTNEHQGGTSDPLR